MKTIRLATTVTAGFALAATVAACNTDLTGLNQDPNNPTDAPAGALFTNAVNSAVGRWLGGGYSLRATEFTSQQIAEAQYPDEDRYARLQGSDTDGWFTGPYTNDLEDLRKIIAKGQATKDAGVYGPAMVMQSWDFGYLTDTWGDVPYTDALMGDSTGGSLAPKYDTQKSIYTGLFTALSNAVKAMSGGQVNGLAGADPLYGGDLGEWEKFANSLHARYAMRIVNVDPATADKELKAAFSAPGGVFTSNADNALLAWPGDGVNDNPWADNFKTRDDHRMSKVLMDILVANKDPRTGIFAQPVADSSLYPGGYGGMPNGLSTSAAGTYLAVASRPGAIFWPGNTSAGFYGSAANLATPSYLMTYAELSFIKAEAAERSMGGLSPSQAKGFYNDAITASLEQWGVTDPAAISAFLAQPGIVFQGNGSGGAGDPGLKQIALQKWVALFTDGGQAWFEWRRTCQPSAVVAGPAATISFVPRRYEYSTTEGTVNEANLDAAIADQGPDNFGTRVWWDTKPTVAPTYVSASVCAGNNGK
ncbi:MAG TPA: SusD/RagB family nutrient-binding outer membrane lipoprotein [Gemmatimonadaceae bacterium]|nr:SusD/RagB family nutrient-binding outer membrane lipoprotein [Gemmatimonadaceae bacterium]